MTKTLRHGGRGDTAARPLPSPGRHRRLLRSISRYTTASDLHTDSPVTTRRPTGNRLLLMDHTRDGHHQVPPSTTTVQRQVRQLLHLTPNKMLQMLPCRSLVESCRNCISRYRHMVSDDGPGELFVRAALVVHPHAACAQFRNEIRT